MLQAVSGKFCSGKLIKFPRLSWISVIIRRGTWARPCPSISSYVQLPQQYYGSILYNKCTVYLKISMWSLSLSILIWRFAVLFHDCPCSWVLHVYGKYALWLYAYCMAPTLQSCCIQGGIINLLTYSRSDYKLTSFLYEVQKLSFLFSITCTDDIRLSLDRLKYRKITIF